MPEWLTARGPLGWFIALLVLIAVFVLWLVHQLDPQTAALAGALALAAGVLLANELAQGLAVRALALIGYGPQHPPPFRCIAVRVGGRCGVGV